MSHDSKTDVNGSQGSRPFIRETLLAESKPQPPFWKRLLITLCLALLFGGAAAVVFHFTREALEQPKESETLPEPITFPADTIPVPGSESPTGEETLPAESSGEESLPEGSLPAEDPVTRSEVMKAIEEALARRTPGLSDYQTVYRSIRNLFSKLSRSLVTLKAVHVGSDWLGQSYTYESESFGVIVAVTGQNVIILAPYSAVASLSEDSAPAVTFNDGTVTSSLIKATDKTSGLSVLSVILDEQMEESVLESIVPAALGNSYTCFTGQPVLAMGAPLGYVGSLSLGTISFVENDVPAIDTTHLILHTALPCGESCLGVLFDLDGKLVGWISSGYGQAGLISAVGISGLKGYIENICNGNSHGLLGIRGRSLPPGQQKEAPAGGVYVLSCEDDSPAVKAGLQIGDIITSVAGASVTSMNTLRECLRNINMEQTVPVTILRLGLSGYRELTLDVRIGTR